MSTNYSYSEDNRATYCPEDNKLRLYVGRVPRDEYLRLRADGWVALPKQREAGKGDFAATWTPSRRNTCLQYADLIEDEDAGPDERAADRAERFGGYRDKRTNEACGHADGYNAQPMAHGYQNAQRAERAAARHDRIADRACDAWDKAEYWQRRTAAVIGHALYKSSPAVRMGRIKTLEAELRKHEKSHAEWLERWQAMKRFESIANPEEQTKAVLNYTGCHHFWGEYRHPRADTLPAGDRMADIYRENTRGLYSLLSSEHYPITGAEALALFFADYPEEPSTDTAWGRHYKMRLAYENQMLDAQGGRAAFVEMESGGMLGGKLILKVNKSAATGRVTSVDVKGPRSDSRGYKTLNPHGVTWSIYQIETERLPENAYTPPTPESLEELNATRAEQKAAAPKKESCPLINPTDADAERLQAIWNKQGEEIYLAKLIKDFGSVEKALKYGSKPFAPSTLCRIRQEVYSAASKGSYARAETKNICAAGEIEPEAYFHCYEKQISDAKRRGPAVCKVRLTSSDSGQWPYTNRVIIITDKPQKALPAAVWEPYTPPAQSEQPSESITCSACGIDSKRSLWESSGSLLFPNGGGIVCPKCGMHQSKTNTRKTYAGKSRGLSYSVPADM